MKNPDDVLVVHFFHDLELTILDFLVLIDFFDSNDLSSVLNRRHEYFSKSTLGYFDLSREIPRLRK